MNREIKTYQSILCPEGVPSFIYEYTSATAMQRLKGVGLFCGTDYARIYHPRYFYSRFDHSVCVALIVWHHTHDQTQALAGLFHDIATPAFSHCVDFMAGDALTQTHTEAQTRNIIERSEQIMELLARDGIALSEVDDYHQYPIADNDSPQLSADRLEYSMSTLLVWTGAWDISCIGALYGDLMIEKNENGHDELTFRSLHCAEVFVSGVCEYSHEYQTNNNKVSLMYVGDLLKECIRQGVVRHDELYVMTEPQLIERIKHASPQIRRMWETYEQLAHIDGSMKPVAGCYCIHVDAKKRHINPLVLAHNGPRRVSALSASARNEIARLMAYEDLAYGFIREAMIL